MFNLGVCRDVRCEKRTKPPRIGRHSASKVDQRPLGGPAGTTDEHGAVSFARHMRKANFSGKSGRTNNSADFVASVPDLYCGIPTLAGVPCPGKVLRTVGLYSSQCSRVFIRSGHVSPPVLKYEKATPSFRHSSGGHRPQGASPNRKQLLVTAQNWGSPKFTTYDERLPEAKTRPMSL